MSLRVHESMINNLALDALSGRTVHEDKLQAAVTDLLGHLPEKMKGDDRRPALCDHLRPPKADLRQLRRRRFQDHHSRDEIPQGRQVEFGHEHFGGVQD